jgi:hypothetical protein
LYLVPFEEEPLTGLYVKTIVAGKSAARLQVFDPGRMNTFSWKQNKVLKSKMLFVSGLTTKVISFL